MRVIDVPPRGESLNLIDADQIVTANAKLVELGAHIARTTDMSTDVGWIDLTNPDPVALAADERRLDEILRRGVLRLE